MDYGLLLRNIARYVKLDKDEEEYLIPLLMSKKVKAKEVLLEAGDVNTKVIFVTGGCLRSYASDNNGFEHILQFAPPGWWIIDMLSFITEEPSRLNIDAIEDSEIIYLLKSDFDTIYLEVPKFERFGRILTMNGMATFQHRQIDNVSLTPAERYIKFCKLYPSLIRDLPLQQIASYIGVSPEFLSKMLSSGVLK
ncbi:MAG: Crp/Fnr family transcriptional regulator [Pedobacter sp.]|uniref:Crp/Fnr family transcriptional regulator n=1 Tax=Pedobacter sp. TaxID=1411316 RepID=UPI003397DC7B